MLPAIPGPKLEPVSPRLKATLVHAERDSELYGVRYSPDGRRVIAGGYPDGIVQVWDAETGRQLTRFEAGHGFRGSAEYFCVSPDWKTLFAPTKSERKRTPFERDGKRLLRWEFDGEVRAWDIETGDLLEVYRHDPRRNIRSLSLSPDGSTFLTGEELPGESEGAPARGVSLWDVKSQRNRPLPAGLNVSLGAFSPDSETVALVARNDDGYDTALKLFDVESLTEELSIPVGHEFGLAGVHRFTPDGAMLLGYVRVFPAHGEWRTWQAFLKLWDASTGEERASFTTDEKNSSLEMPVFSPDGRLIAAVRWQSEQGKLYLIDLVDRKLVATLVLTRKCDEGERLFQPRPAFSPDGRWLAVITQFLPEGFDTLEPEELSQARIHLVDVAKCAVAETLVSPQGLVASVCFSPDGKTLAAGGHGKVLLWDLEALPGSSGER